MNPNKGDLMAEPEVIPERGHVFLSYARADDEPFVKRLRDDLIASGQPVWWDRKSMSSRGRTFLQEIRDAIERSERVVAVIGPNAVTSEYVRVEWDHARNFCKGVLPILRDGDYDLVPQDIAKLHCVDVREIRPYDAALDELLDKLAEPVPPLGPLTLVPSLPPHYLPRSEDMDPVAETVLADVRRPVVITSAQTDVGAGGHGRCRQVGAGGGVRADGRHPPRVHRRRDLAHHRPGPKSIFGLCDPGHGPGDDPVPYAQEETARARLSKVLADKTCLIVLDDVWNVADAAPFRDALGPNGK